LSHDEERQEPGPTPPRTLPRLIALERSCEYLCWCVVLPNQGALTCELIGPPRPVLWDTLDDALDHYGTGVTVDPDPVRHAAPELLAASPFNALTRGMAQSVAGGDGALPLSGSRS
jgi:hypothetical protein